MTKAAYLLSLALIFSPALLADKVIHREKSLYRNILVTQRADRRCLAFSVKRQRRNQTCMNVRQPTKIVFPYVRMTFAGLLVNPKPRKVMMIGLGGGTITTVLTELYPDLEIDVVEVDEAVVRVAEEYFGFRATEKTNVIVQDGRVFTRRAALRGETYDYIILDAYTGDYIPEHLMTHEFLSDIRDLLTPDGIVVANTFALSDLYDHESVTYASVFGDFLNLKVPGTGNRIIVAGKGTLPERSVLAAEANRLGPRLEPYSVDLLNLLSYLDRNIDWDTTSRPLTDQFSPANLLRGR
ncbi:MAG: fused MFS/spermidine synthase [Gammaproteobacteria bacterium]|jgi:spermidine synthase|nr:fused MFS/spermidine synthase [Gammaproteobacteria bacterium]MBT7369778.1 fused MFS/spermidine synthase [Gammaproteobacteria bacterium]